MDKKIVLQGEEILKILPQSHPFVFIDTLYEPQKDIVETTFTIPTLHSLTANNQLSIGGLIENMAQTAAAGIGYKYFLKNETPPIGFIGSIKKLNIIKNPEIGQTINTTISEITNLGSISVVEARVHFEETIIASAELNIFLQN